MSTLTAEQQAVVAQMLSKFNLADANIKQSNLEISGEMPNIKVSDVVTFLQASGFPDTYFGHSSTGNAFVLAWSKAEGKRFFVNFFTTDYKKIDDSIMADISEDTNITFREARYRQDYTYVHPTTKVETLYAKGSTIYSLVLEEIEE